MPYAVTHVLLTIILVDLYRDYITKHKKHFTLHTIFIAGIAGLLPDIDIPLNPFLKLFKFGITHGTITHTPLFGMAFIIPAIILWKLRRKKMAVYLFVISFGILFHIFLDYTFSSDDGGYMLLYPLSNHRFSLNLLNGFNPNLLAGIDAIILLAWLYHEEIKHKISDFI